MLKYFISIFFGTVLLFSCGQEATKKSSPQPVKETVADSLLMLNLPDTVTDANHSVLMDLILGKPKHNIKNIGILVYDGVNELDMMGPRYVFGESGAKTLLIALKPGNIKTAMGVEIVPNTVLDSVNQLDILIIPGGFKGTIEAVYDKSLHEWIRKIDQSTTYTASVCTGGWILGATGLLQGKRASTNWYKEEDFLKKYGAIPANERYTQDGKYWTSAGVTAGMDMALAILKDNWGEKYAQAVMLDMEYDPAPPIEGGSPEKTGRLVRWMMKSMYDAGVNPIIDSLENKVK
jgi:transcriptional regulator GlxA family with amidase domain